jgi:SAM-dependent methyltransferase
MMVHTPTDNPLWLDIACNDGTLLSYVPSPYSRLGIDPADDSYTKESVKFADQVVQEYFSKNTFDRSIFKGRKCDVITCIAMFYDLPDPVAFLNDVYDVLHDEGLFVVQMSYTPLMVQQMAFDNICHEHLMYYSLHSFKHVIEKAKFKIVDCELNDVNGGSFRVYLQKDIAKVTSFATAPYRDVARYRINSTLEYENKIGANTVEFYMNFYKKLQELKEKTYNFIKQEKEKGKSIWVYGASTKGNTLLQYFGLDKTLIDGAAERSPYKFGLKTVGTDITIYSEQDMRKANPDYLLILPWHFIDEFKRREAPYLMSGGHFIVPCPVFEIV